MGRFLRSKRHRALLWYAAEGLCQQCQAPLPDAWHADHVTPWWLTQTTNVHEMQALCPRCNISKGAAMPERMHPRRFQQAFAQLVQEIMLGTLPVRALYCPITPGAGKSSLPLILTRLIPTIADKLCWIVPRITLASQAEQAFTNKKLGQLFPHTLRIRHDTNTPNPCRDLGGYATTYQSVTADPSLHVKEFARYRYLLFLDEPHHVKTHFSQPEHAEFAWSHAIQPLVDRAALVVYASGTMERHDQKPIFGLPYVINGKEYGVDLPLAQTVRYSRQDALAERAIVPLQFIVRDGTAVWRDPNGATMERESFDETSLETGQMLDATLQTDFARHLLADTVTHWLAHRQYYPRGKILIVAPRIPLARLYAKWLKTDHQLHVRIATSDDAKDAKEAIDAFKGRLAPETDALVTVGMAYEGLDVPDITHIACLTRYRSRPWLEQCFARACRTADGKQAGYVFAPDDPLLNQVVAAIRQEQEGVAKDLDPQEPEGGPQGPKGPTTEDGRVLPLTSQATAMRAYDFQQSMTREETARIALIMQQHGIAGISPLQLKRAFDAMDFSPPSSPPENPAQEELTPTEQEERYRDAIDQYTKSVDFTYFDGAWGSTNLEIRRQGFAKRESLTISQLEQLWQWLQNRYPLGPMDEEDVI